MPARTPNARVAMSLTVAAAPLVALAAGALAGCTARDDVDGARMHARVVRQVEFGPRIPGTDAHAAMRAWLVAELERLGGRVEEQTVEDSVGGRWIPITNVIARFGPDAGRPILLGAHWDTRAFADRDPDPARRQDPVPGANDGGSGVAVLLEIAELMKAKAPPRGVELVFFDAEDQGREGHSLEYCRGSQAYARLLAPRIAAGSAPIAGFIFDMVGDRDLTIHPEGISLQRARNLVRLVHEGAQATGATRFFETPKGSVFDDHVPLLEAGIPTVDIIDFEYEAWHTTRDLPDQVSAESLAEVARVGAWIVYQSPLARAR